MQRKTPLIVISLLIIIAGIILLINFNYGKEVEVCFKNYCFDVELAITPEEKSRGLMFREELDSDRGMLFVFNEEGEYSFWMKNTLIPLDIIWINENNEIVFISENTQPCGESLCPSINPGKNAKYVLEINGGISKRIGLKVGDKVSLKIE